MKSLKIFALVVIAMLLAAVVFAAQLTAEDRGKALFNDTKLGSGTTGKSCGSCHPDGKGLEKTGGMAEEKIPEMVNNCISNALKGTALDVKSEQMQDLVSYIKSIKPKTVEKPKRKRVVGC